MNEPISKGEPTPRAKARGFRRAGLLFLRPSFMTLGRVALRQSRPDFASGPAITLLGPPGGHSSPGLKARGFPGRDYKERVQLFPKVKDYLLGYMDD